MVAHADFDKLVTSPLLFGQKLWMLLCALGVYWVAVSAPAQAADLAPLPINPPAVWLQQIYADPGEYGGTSINAPAGQQPARLQGPLAGPSFSLYADAMISAAEDSIEIDLSGSTSSYQTMGLTVFAAPIDLAISLPESAQSVVQIFAEWSLSTAPGWTTSARFSCAETQNGPDRLEVEGLGNVSGVSALLTTRSEPAGPIPTQVGIATLPSGESIRTRCSLWLGIKATGQTTGPFHVAGTLRFRIAQPLPLGDANADGSADLVDVVVLRRQLAGFDVP
jgi:hypothetical protein